MPVEQIHTYLVYPRPIGGEEREIGGVALPLRGRLYETLNNVYEKSDSECEIEIAFSPRADGVQQNDCRDLVLQYIRELSIDSGREIARRLGQHTDNRSKLGLLFLLYGQEGRDHKLVISRYPTDTGILAEEGDEGLNVQFLERVFMRSAFAYKAALYRHPSLNRFWDGKVVDKQATYAALPSPEYWIHGFLASDFKTTPAAGTRRLALAIKKAISSSDDLELKNELVAAAVLARGLAGQQTSITSFCQRYNLSDRATAAIRQELPNPTVASQNFSLDVAVFDAEVGYRSIQLDSGVTITAQSAEFNELVAREQVGGEPGAERFVVEGRVIDEKLRKSMRMP